MIDCLKELQFFDWFNLFDWFVFWIVLYSFFECIIRARSQLWIPWPRDGAKSPESDAEPDRAENPLLWSAFGGLWYFCGRVTFALRPGPKELATNSKECGNNLRCQWGILRVWVSSQWSDWSSWPVGQGVLRLNSLHSNPACVAAFNLAPFPHFTFNLSHLYKIYLQFIGMFYSIEYCKSIFLIF